MSAPVVFAIAPTVGPTRGDMVVEITGSDFRVPDVPAHGEPAPAPTTRVFFGDVPSPLVEVLSTSLLLVSVPAHDAGAVAVVVENIDEDGEAIPGESDTVDDAFTFEIPRYTKEYESDLARMVRVLLRVLKQQTLAKEVTRPVHTDFDKDTGDQLNIAKVGGFPAITLMGPRMRENRFYSDNEQPTVTVDVDGEGNPVTFIETRVPYVVDLTFTVVGVSDRDTELLNVMSSFVQFMHRNKYVRLPLIEGTPALGHAVFEFDFVDDGEPQMPGTPNNSNIHQWSAEVVVRGFPIEELSGLSTGLVPGTAVPTHAVIAEGKTALTVNVDPAAQIGDD